MVYNIYYIKSLLTSKTCQHRRTSIPNEHEVRPTLPSSLVVRSGSSTRSQTVPNKLRSNGMRIPSRDTVRVGFRTPQKVSKRRNSPRLKIKNKEGGSKHSDEFRYGSYRVWKPRQWRKRQEEGKSKIQGSDDETLGSQRVPLSDLKKEDRT